MTSVTPAPLPSVVVEPLRAEDLNYVPPKSQSTVLHRSPGLHHSQVVNDLYYRVIRRMEFADDPDGAWRMNMGFTWERAIELAYKEVEGRRVALVDGVLRPKEAQLDGIFMHPDGFKPESDDEEGYIVEYKATWKTARKLNDHEFTHEFKPWDWQVAGYCKRWGVLCAVFYVMCFLGDYKGSKKAGAYRVVRRYTQEELDRIWQMLLGHAAQMRKAGFKGEGEK